MAGSPFQNDAISTAAILSDFPTDTEIWNGMKKAIAESSGFQRWQLERSFEGSNQSTSLDEQVRCYLRETLATLAY